MHQQNGNRISGKRLPQREIAAVAGVSISTVSRVLNHADTISPTIKERVLRAATSLGYPLTTTRLENVTVFLRPYTSNAVTDQFFIGIVEGMEMECRKHAIRLNQMYSEPGPLATSFVLDKVRQNNDDGFIFLSQDDTELLDAVRTLTHRLVLVNSEYEDPLVDEFLPNNTSGARIAMQYLLHKGHTKILCAASFLRSTLRHRHDVYRTMLEEAGITYDPNLLLTLGNLTMEVAYEQMQTFLAEPHPKFTAVFCANDGAAMGIMRALQEAGLHVPQDVSIMGFDDINFSAFTNPPLTTIHIERNELGRLAVRRLLERVEEPTLVPIRVETYCRLVERQSVAAITS